MNISLTKDLEDYLNSQMKTGQYASISELIREALRIHISLSFGNKIDEHILLGRQEAARGKVFVANNKYFDNARQYVKDKYN